MLHTQGDSWGAILAALTQAMGPGRRWGECPRAVGAHRDPGNCSSETWPGCKVLHSPPCLVAHLRNHRGFKTHLLSLPCHLSPSTAALSHAQSRRLVAVCVPSKTHPSCPNRSRFLWEAPIGISVWNSPTLFSPAPTALGPAGRAGGHSLLPGRKQRVSRGARAQQCLADMFPASKPLHLAIA